MKLINQLSVLLLIILAYYAGYIIAEETLDEASTDTGDVIEGILAIANLIKFLGQFAAYAAEVGPMAAIGSALCIVLISLLMVIFCGSCLEESSKKKYQPLRIGGLAWNLLSD